jgi:hypothetical protein
VSGFLVAVDYGTVNTVALLRRPDGQVRPLLFDGSPLLPSAVCVGPDGRLVVGRDAETAARVDPEAFVPDPRNRIDAGTVLLGGHTFPVVDVIRATLARVVHEAIRGTGGVLPRLVLAHPAAWDESRCEILTEAGFRTGLGVPTLVPAPVAAAWYHSESVGDIGPDRRLLVYHLGAATFEASVLRRAPEGYELLAKCPIEDFGGVDLDDVMVKVVGAAVPPGAAATWQRLVTPDTTAEARLFTQLCDDARAAKEALSRHLTVALHIPLVDQDVEITREAFEAAAEPLLARTVELAANLLAVTGTSPDQLGDVLLLGGSSRIPLVATLLRRRLGQAPTACRQPELAVAEGALTAVSRMDSPPLAPAMAATVADGPTQDLTGSVARLAATPAWTGPGPRRRSTRLLAVATGLVSVAVIAGWYAVREPGQVVSAGIPPLIGTGPTATGPGAGVLSSVPAATTPTGPASRGSPSMTPSPSASSTSMSPTASTGPAAVAVSVTVTPPAGTCATDFTFVAHFTVNKAGKYRWHWVFGGPGNYLSGTGDHDQDRTGDVHIGKKFDVGRPGIYWGKVQITAPVTAASGPASVQVACVK